MNSKYFRRRKPFDFDPHPLDVGVPFSKNDTHADVHFLIKVQRLPESQLEDLFLRHFNYYKAEFNDTDGREFFKELWQTVNSELKKERSKSQEKLSATQKRRNDLRIQKFQYRTRITLVYFLNMLVNIPPLKKFHCQILRRL